MVRAAGVEGVDAAGGGGVDEPDVREPVAAHAGAVVVEGIGVRGRVEGVGPVERRDGGGAVIARLGEPDPAEEQGGGEEVEMLHPVE